METNTRRLPPLLTAAAISVTVFSAVGIASITGLIPHSIGSQKEERLPQKHVSPQAAAEGAKPAVPVAAPCRSREAGRTGHRRAGATGCAQAGAQKAGRPFEHAQARGA